MKFLPLFLLPLVHGTVCTAPMDLVFLLDSSASVRSSDFEIAKTFVKTIAGRYEMSDRAVHISLVNFANWAATIWDFADDASSSFEKLTAKIDAMPARGAEGNGNTCVAEGMDMVAQKIVGPNGPGSRTREADGGTVGQSTVIIVITDGKPVCSRRWCAKFSPCECRPGDFLYGCTCCEEWVNKGVSRSVRSAERLKTLKLFHDRADTVVGVGVGPKVDKAYIDTLSKNVPSGNYFHADDYSSMDNLLENLAKVACPTSVPSLAPTAAPSTTPSNAPTAIPSGHPTHSGTCTVAERNLCDAAHGICSCAGSDPVTGCDIKVCTCSQGTACKVGSADCAICTVTPTSAPSTLSPTQVPSTTPTFAPSLSTAPTAAPSIDPFFLVDDPLDDSDGQEATSPLAVTTQKTGAMIAIGAVAIIGIIVASIIGAIIVIAAMGGVGMFAIKHLMFEVETDVVTGEEIPPSENYNNNAAFPPRTTTTPPIAQLYTPPPGASSAAHPTSFNAADALEAGKLSDVDGTTNGIELAELGTSTNGVKLEHVRVQRVSLAFKAHSGVVTVDRGFEDTVGL